jgi:hypothetical protein
MNLTKIIKIQKWFRGCLFRLNCLHKPKPSWKEVFMSNIRTIKL